MPIHCLRCRSIFETNAQLADHLQVIKDNICEPNVHEAVEGLTPDQERKMRKRNRGMTEEERWRELYLILFPDTDPATVPSPCKHSLGGH